MEYSEPPPEHKPEREHPRTVGGSKYPYSSFKPALLPELVPVDENVPSRDDTKSGTVALVGLAALGCGCALYKKNSTVHLLYCTV